MKSQLVIVGVRGVGIYMGELVDYPKSLSSEVILLKNPIFRWNDHNSEGDLGDYIIQDFYDPDAYNTEDIFAELIAIKDWSLIAVCQHHTLMTERPQRPKRPAKLSDMIEREIEN